MDVFVVGLLLIIAAVVVLDRQRSGAPPSWRHRDAAPQRSSRIVVIAGSGAAALLGLILVGASSAYAQDTGDASVIVSWTGDILGQETAPGLHVKAPWSDGEDLQRPEPAGRVRR